MSKIELLSPAGDAEKLNMALLYGADAVYMAGKEFGMRVATDNFSEDELKKAIELCHKKGKKIYITLNTMARNNEIARLSDYLSYLNEIKPDAIIVADAGVLSLAKKYAPNIDLHISTQASIVNYEAANFWHSLGAKRLVLARELSLDEIAEIRAKTDKTLELEAFVHGAMCMSYSGRCLISNFLTKRDANRGACSQPCRFKYFVVEEKRPGEYFEVEEHSKGTHLFNSKDLCMIEHIDKLKNAGITSFKIEGRVKTAYYTAVVTNAYRMAIDAYEKNPNNYKCDDFWLSEVKKVSHRHYSYGFYFGANPESEFHDDSKYIRDYDVCAIVKSCDDEGNAILAQRNKFSKGESIELIEPQKKPVEIVVNNMYNSEDELVETANKAEMIVKIKLPHKFIKNTIVRKKREQ